MKKLLLTLICALALVACKEEKKLAPIIRSVHVIKVEAVSAFPRRAFPGKAKSVKEANLSFDVSGTLKKLPVNVGDKLKKGALIAELDTRDFVSNVTSTKSELARSSKNLERAEELVAKDFIAKSEYDKIFTAVEVARSSHELAKKALEDATMLAPFAGEIMVKYVENFEAIRAKQTIARLLDISEIEMVVNIPESLMGRVQQLKTADVVFDAFPGQHYTAVITEIGREASKTTRTYPITLTMPQVDTITILPGMAGNARAKEVTGGDENKRSLVLPLTAVFTPNDKKQESVWVLDKEKNTVSLRAIEVLSISAQGVSVKSGLKNGEWVIIAGVHSLHSNQKVKPLTGKVR